MKNLNSILLLIVFFVAACSPETKTATPEPKPALSGSQSKNDNVLVAEGPGSTGGGFKNTNSTNFLADVSSRLANLIEQQSPELFKNFPADLGQKEMAAMIRNIRHMQKKAVPPRKNLNGVLEDIMFNYGKDQDGLYLEALSPYFEGYTWVPMGEIERLRTDQKPLPDIFILNFLDLETRLLHEFAHHLGKGESEARSFSKRFRNARNRDYTVCTETPKNFPKIISNIPEENMVILDRRTGTLIDIPYAADEKSISDLIESGIASESCAPYISAEKDLRSSDKCNGASLTVQKTVSAKIDSTGYTIDTSADNSYILTKVQTSDNIVTYSNPQGFSVETFAPSEGNFIKADSYFGLLLKNSADELLGYSYIEKISIDQSENVASVTRVYNLPGQTKKIEQVSSKMKCKNIVPEFNP